MVQLEILVEILVVPVEIPVGIPVVLVEMPVEILVVPVENPVKIPMVLVEIPEEIAVALAEIPVVAICSDGSGRESTIRESTVSRHRFWIRSPTRLGVYSWGCSSRPISRDRFAYAKCESGLGVYLPPCFYVV